MLGHELEALFGKQTIREAEQLRPDQVDALAVHDAAGALLRLRQYPNEQRELVATMRPDTAAALCRWIAEPAFWAVVSGITKQ